MKRDYIISHTLGRVVRGPWIISVICVSLYIGCFVSYPLFEFLYLSGSEAVGLSDQRNNINFILQGPHELYINWTQPTGGHELYLAF